MSLIKVISLDQITEPREGPLAEIYRSFSATTFSVASEQRVLTLIQTANLAEIGYYLPVQVLEGRGSNYTLCAGFRGFQILRSAGLEKIPARVVHDICPVQSLKREIVSIYSYSSDDKTTYKNLNNLREALRANASSKLKEQIKMTCPELYNELSTNKRALRKSLPGTSRVEAKIKIIQEKIQ